MAVLRLHQRVCRLEDLDPDKIARTDPGNVEGWDWERYGYSHDD